MNTSRPTFGGTTVGTSPTVSSAGHTSLTSVFTSFTLGTVLGFFNSLLSTPSQTTVQAPAQTTVTNQIVIEGQPTQPSSGGSQTPEITIDMLQTPTEATVGPNSGGQTQVSAQTSGTQQVQPFDYQSLLDLIEGGTPASSILTTILGVPQQQSSGAPDQEITDITSSGEGSLGAGSSPAASIGTDSQIASQVPAGSALTMDNVTDQNISVAIPQQFFDYEASLAQAQSDYEWLQAQEAAWEAAKGAGVCGDDCEDAIAQLQEELPAQASRVLALKAVVEAGPLALQTTFPNQGGAADLESNVAIPGGSSQNIAENTTSSLQTPVPSAGAPYYVQQNNEWCDQYGQCIPNDQFESSPQYNPPASASVSAGATTSAAATDPVEVIVDTVKGWWHDILSWFTPSAAPTSNGCSLFRSLFGGCKGY